MKKVIAFDLDGTLAASKSPAADRMVEALNRLLDNFQVCVISGGKFEQFQKQLLSNLKTSPDKLEKLHLMPTCGTRYYTYDLSKKDWKLIYAEDFTEVEKKKISQAVNRAVDDLEMREKETYGELIEDRGSQMAFSALGQDIIEELGKEGLKRKEEWDPTNAKKAKLRDRIAELIPEFEVRSGGLTTIDITKLGIDKAYGMKKLCELLEVSKEDILFFGDRIIEGGNDYPVKAAGIDCLQVSRWEDTALALEAILAVVEN
jgi:phosphomannomutase